MSFPDPTQCWAKTLPSGEPGMSVRDHCLNVGCVAEAILNRTGMQLSGLIPEGIVTLAALHDVGKISTGFQSKCPAWLIKSQLAEVSIRERWTSASESDHAKVSQYFLQRFMKPTGAMLWGVAAGVHHGRIHGRQVKVIETIRAQAESEQLAREQLLTYLVSIFGNLPDHPPQQTCSNLWCAAGLITVSDWIGSNEVYFPVGNELSLRDRREAAERALDQLHWGGGQFRSRSFGELFGGYSPMALQVAIHSQCDKRGLFLVEGPMGCGKTEAALWAAHRLIETGANNGLYFALPTQVTSNRIHERVAPFLRSALNNAAELRLAHASSWLDNNETWRLYPTDADDPQATDHIREARSWFSSSKRAMLTPFGVGTIDQALQGVVAVKHFFVRRFGLAGKVVILDEVHSYDVYTGALITQLIKELLALRCSVIVLSATLTRARRRELIAAAHGQPESATSLGYPLVTVVKENSPIVEVEVAAPKPRTLKLKTVPLSEDEILNECVERAESGQHVLYLRNTVAEAQQTYRKAKGFTRAGLTAVATLHSRYPFFRRQELEEHWLKRLGKKRVHDETGSLLIATQVVEQSVDIDLDFIVSDLAPTDMLLQRMGRLWRHEREDRLAKIPEFWINVPTIDPNAGAETLIKVFGKSGLVYAPYALLRSADVFTARKSIILPDQIRELIEATYADRQVGEEPEPWTQLRTRVDVERAKLAQAAEAVTRVLGQQSIEDKTEFLTRRKGAPTREVVLVRSCIRFGRDQWQLTMLDGESLLISSFAWTLAAAQAIHRNKVRIPRYCVPEQVMPAWLKQHSYEPTCWSVVKEDGEMNFADAEETCNLAYDPLQGIFTPSEQPRTTLPEDDDEFDY